MAPTYLTTSNARQGPHLEANGSCLCDTQNLSACDLQLGFHEYADLEQIFEEYAQCRNGFNHPRQTRAHREWLECRENLRLDSKNPSIHSLRKCAKIFDDIFFLGTLRDKCRLDWSPGLLKNDNFTGSTQEISSCTLHQQIHKVQILIEPCPCEDVNDSCPFILKTLLHELCHSALMLFGCKRTMDARTHLMYFGLTGHGSSFFNLFRATLREAKNKLKVNLESQDVCVDSKRLEQRVLGVVLGIVGATPLDISVMDLADLERALGNTLYPGEGVFWKIHDISYAEFAEIYDSFQRNSKFRLKRSPVETRRIRNFQVVEDWSVPSSPPTNTSAGPKFPKFPYASAFGTSRHSLEVVFFWQDVEREKGRNKPQRVFNWLILISNVITANVSIVHMLIWQNPDASRCVSVVLQRMYLL